MKKDTKVSYWSPFVPAEWIAAHGCTPHILRPHGQETRGLIENRAGICAFMRAFVNEAVSDPGTDAIVVTTTCDQMRRSLDLIEGQTTKPVFLFHVPVTWQSPASHRYYTAELKRLGGFLEKLGGHEADGSKLKEVMTRFESGRRAVLSSPLKSVGPELTDSLNHFYASGEVPRSEEKPPAGIPVAIVGGPLTESDSSLIRLIEEHGGQVVLDGTENGERTLPGPFNARRLGTEPFELLSEAYFGTIPDVFRRPNSALFSWLAREVKTRQIKGVILMRYVWCDCWHGEVNRIRDWLDIPSVDIDLNSDDPMSRNRTRIEAFMESLCEPGT